MFAQRALATSFDAQADAYARLRPGYPPAAVDLAIPADSRRVLDLGAGTGKLTGPALDRVPEVIAVEPLPGMLTELHRRFPGALAVEGSAEQIPLLDNVVDAIVVGQAFHWFDPAPALAEMARVLRPGGSLALLWNHDDEADPLFREIQDALGRAGRPLGGSTQRATGDNNDDDRGQREQTGDQPTSDEQHAADGQQPRGSTNPPFSGHPCFTDPVLTEIGWQRTQPVADLSACSTPTRTSSGPPMRRGPGWHPRCARSCSAITFPAIARPPVVIPAFCQVWRSSCR